MTARAGVKGKKRLVQLGPQRGVEQSMTVIISFHDTFITKVDRAYRCTCFFMEADKVLYTTSENATEGVRCRVLITLGCDEPIRSEFHSDDGPRGHSQDAHLYLQRSPWIH